MSKRLWPAWCVSLLVTGMIFAVVVGLRRMGYLQRPEFFAYDFFIKHRSPVMATDPRIVIVGINEDDIHTEDDTVTPRLPYPIWDAEMVRLLEAIEAQHPRMIGLDIFRDIAVPDVEQRKLFNQFLLTNPNVVCTFQFKDTSNRFVRPPTVLAGMRDRIACGDLPVDPADRVIRRGFLYLDDGKNATNQFLSLAALLTTGYLDIQFEPDTNDPTAVRLGRASFRPLEANDGPYVNLNPAGFQFLMDFRGPRNFGTVSWSQLMGGTLPTNRFSDKIVIVGMTAYSVHDDWSTAMEQSQRGIEIHAEAVNQLLRAALDGEPQRAFWTDWQKDAWTLLWCLLGGAVGYAIRSPWRSYGLLCAALLILTGMAWRAFDARWWIPLATPAVACVAAAVSVNWYISYQEKAQRQMIMQLFSKQVSREVAEAIWKERNEFLDGGRPRSQELTATVLYTDLKGYSLLSETRDPSTVMVWLNEYMTAMSDVVASNHGVIDKFIGDSVMALFGVPVARKTDDAIKEDAVNAVRCALEMETALHQLNAAWKSDTLPTCRMRVGIYTGSVVAGSLGSAERMEYTVIGGTVNTASRLESFDKSYEEPDLADRCSRILIGGRTWDLVKDRFETRCIGEITPPGMTQSVMVYRVVNKVSQRQG